MAAVPLIGNVSLLDDLNYLRKFQLTQKRLEREVYSEYNVNREVLEFNVERQFLAHPQEFRFESSSEGSSNVEKQSTSAWSEHELKLEDERKKIHKDLTGQSRQLKSAPLNNEAKNNKKTQNVKNVDRKMSAKSVVPKTAISDTEFDKKFQIYVEKSMHNINEIRSVMERGIEPPDGEEDISRRLLRVKEFCNRFSRNYLYPLARQLESLNDHKTPSLNQKLLSAYQIILNGLQAYLNHLPTSIGGCSADKFKLLLKYLLELCDVHQKRNEAKVDIQLIKSFKMNAELTLQKVEDHLNSVSNENILKTASTRDNLVKKKVKKTKQVKSNIADRLSMYYKPQTFRKDLHTISQKRINVKSRYKNGIYRNRQPTGDKIIDEPASRFPSKCKLFPKKSSIIFKKTPMTTPVNEDNITTLIQMEQNEDVDENKNKMESNHEELVVRLLQLVLADGNDGKKREVSKVAEMLNELKNGIDKEKLEKILKELEEIKKEKDGDVNKLELKVKESPKMRKEPQVTVTGAKNAKLICIKDDNSVIETDEEIDPEIKDKSNEKCTIPLKAVSSSHTQTDCDKINKSTQRPTNQCHVMKKLKRSSRHLKMLPKDYVIKIIQYKLNFHKYCKNIPMYRKTANIQPWILMSRVSDNMLDLALLQVAQEIEANDIAAQIYRSELQL